MADYYITEQDVFDGIPDDDGKDTWEYQERFWSAIGRLAQRKLVEWEYQICHEHREAEDLSCIRLWCPACMQQLRKEVGLG